ncbi:hypothetical protein BT93_K1711 [Corymbia citriodora subsp. variegata]|nr:hypothetical protein BT93_K1711 [Corymbia citriodora subsp. variegata]
MGEKDQNGKKFEAPSEPKEKVQHMTATQKFGPYSTQEIRRALEQCKAFDRERKENGEEGARGESGAFPDCPREGAEEMREKGEVPMEPQEKFVPSPIAPKKVEVTMAPKEKFMPFPIAPKKKQKEREKAEVTMEPKEKVEHLPVAPKKKQKKMTEGSDTNGAKGENRAFPDCPKQLTKRSSDGKWTPSAQFINLLEKEKAKSLARVPAEWKERVKIIREIVKETEPDLTEEGIYEMLEQCNMDPDLTTEILLANSLGNLPRCSIPPIRNDSPDLPFSPFHHMTYGSMEHPAMMSMNAPPFAPSASIHQSAQTLLRGNSLSLGCGFTRPYGEQSYYQPQLPLQHDYMNHDGDMHQNFGYDMTTPQQEVYQGGSSSQVNADPSSWESFPGRRSTPHRFLPNSPAPSDTSISQLNFASHVPAQHQQRNDHDHIGTNYNFTAQNNQPAPGAMSALPEQQGGFPGWVPLPSDVNNQDFDMPSAQQEVYQGGGSSWANGNASGQGSIQGTGSTSYQSPPIPPHSPAFFNISSGHDSTLQAQKQYRNDHSFSLFPPPALTPHGSHLGRVPRPANGLAGEGSSEQYIHQGHPSRHRPGKRVRPNHQQ